MSAPEFWNDQAAARALIEKKNALEAERTAKNRAGQEMNENLLNLERAVAKLDQKRATSAMEEKQILDRLWERYELNHSDAQAQRTMAHIAMIFGIAPALAPIVARAAAYLAWGAKKPSVL